MNRGTVGLVGAGAVGPAILRLLHEAGWTVGSVASRREESAVRAVGFAGEGSATGDNRKAARDADLLVIAVPDRAIAEVAEEVADAAKEGSLALHLSGALSSTVLSPLAARGVSTGTLHPLQSFADSAAAARRIGGSFLFYEGDDTDRIRAVADDLGGRPVPIDREGKVLYHAGAAAACNLAVAMVDLGVGLMEAAGIDAADALDALLPLLSGTVRNLEEVGLPAALTGPVARGDVDTVRRHLEEIGRVRPDLLAPYAEASRHAVKVGLRKGSLTPEDAALILRRLDEATEAR